MERMAPNSVKVVVFNLGYLPGLVCYIFGPRAGRPRVKRKGSTLKSIIGCLAVSVITLTLSLMYPEADSSHPIFDVMVLVPLLLTIIALGMFAQVHSTLGAVFRWL
jgi:hypothetical protein